MNRTKACVGVNRQPCDRGNRSDGKRSFAATIDFAKAHCDGGDAWHRNRMEEGNLGWSCGLRYVCYATSFHCVASSCDASPFPPRAIIRTTGCNLVMCLISIHRRTWLGECRFVATTGVNISGSQRHPSAARKTIEKKPSGLWRRCRCWRRWLSQKRRIYKVAAQNERTASEEDENIETERWRRAAAVAAATLAATQQE